MSIENLSLDEEAPKRGRGRPKGSLNKATIARMQAEAASIAVEGYDPSTHVLDVDFDSDEILGDTTTAEIAEAVEAEELDEPEVEPAPRLKRSRSTQSDLVKLAAPKAPPPRPRRRSTTAVNVLRASVAPRDAADTAPTNYIDVIKRGLEMARAAHRADRMARYDTFFRM